MPFVDANELENGATLSTDLCVIGAGPAGLALARELNAGGLDIAIIESGGLSIDAQTQNLAVGSSVGVTYPPLQATRLRFFGGTSNHWAGNVKALDEIDFLERDWIPNSGWPLRRQDLDPFYVKAANLCGFPEKAYDLLEWQQIKGASPWNFEDQTVRSDVFRTVGHPRLRFGQSLRDEFADSKNITTYLNLNVKTLEQSTEDGRITGAQAVTLAGKDITLLAKKYVLATGGIENARLLLLSPGVSGNGLGNENDLVGRFFMEHLTIPDFCRLLVADQWADLGFYKSLETDAGSVWGTLNPSATSQRTEQFSNCRFQLSTITNTLNENIDAQGMKSLRSLTTGTPKNDDTEFLHHIANLIADVDIVADAMYQRFRYHPNYPLVSIEVVAIGEQIPNPDSRVTLGSRLDALGQREAVLDWQLTEQDNENVRRHARFLAQQFGVSKHGRLVQDFDEGVFDVVPPQPHIHHMGTTRMHDDPSKGVVDRNCRLHGSPNLYVAGSSVFPTVGNVNPTLTIMALAMRLATHLQETWA